MHCVLFTSLVPDVEDTQSVSQTRTEESVRRVASKILGDDYQHFMFRGTKALRELTRTVLVLAAGNYQAIMLLPGAACYLNNRLGKVSPVSSVPGSSRLS